MQKPCLKNRHIIQKLKCIVVQLIIHCMAGKAIRAGSEIQTKPINKVLNGRTFRRTGKQRRVPRIYKSNILLSQMKEEMKFLSNYKYPVNDRLITGSRKSLRIERKALQEEKGQEPNKK